VRRRWPLLALLSALQLLAYADRFVLAAVLPRIEDDFHLSHATGGLLGTLFLLGYFVASPVVGRLADRGHGRVLLAAGTVVWSLGTMACGWAPGVAWLAVGRVLVGAAEASVGAIAPEIVERIAPPERRGAWLGFFYVAAQIGAALGVIGGGMVDHYAGWRHAFVVAGAPGLALAGLCLWIDPVVARGRPAAQRATGGIAELFGRPRYVRIVVGYCAYTFAVGAFGFWAPELVSTRFHLDLATGNLGLGVVSLGGGVAGTLLGGILGDRVSRGRDAGEDRAAALVRCCAWACGLAAPLAAAAILAPGYGAFLGWLFGCQLVLFVTTAPVNGALLHTAPPAARATALAVAIFCIHLFGDLGSPSAVGALADVFTLGRAMLLLPVVLAGAAIVWSTAARAGGRAPLTPAAR
jgi:MFS family permease